VGFFTASTVARLGVAMSGVGLLWTVRHDGGSFAVAGGGVGGFAMGQALGADPDRILRLAARAEWKGDPPERVLDWLADRGVEI